MTLLWKVCLRLARNTAPPRSLQAANVTFIFGQPVSRGIGEGKVVILRRVTLPENLGPQAAGDAQRELERIQEAVTKVRHRLNQQLKYAMTPTGTAVLQADLALAGDVLLVEKLTEQVLNGKSAAQAVTDAGEFFMNLLGQSENEYVRQRAVDIEEICLQLLEEVCETAPTNGFVELREPSVLVAETLAPQQLLQLDRRWLKAIVLEHSAATSHAAILARSLGIPTLAGVREARLLLTPGGEVVVDADRGFIVPQLSPRVTRFYERERKTLKMRREAWSSEGGKSAVTLDGKPMEVAANASSGEELALAFENGADGIGLFRTEAIFLGRQEAPSEDEQFTIYSEAARAAGGRPVIIRTFDIGGDKNVPYLNLPHEDNPFLVSRRSPLPEHHDLLQTQLRAILRASMVGSVQIMMPMISSLEEIVEFKAAVTEPQEHLRGKASRFVPKSKLASWSRFHPRLSSLTSLCAEVDFFSIGTNDLSQYFFAADRRNPKISSLFSVRHPSFLRFAETPG